MEIRSPRRFNRLLCSEAFQGWMFISPWLIGFLAFTAGPMVASLILSFTDYSLFEPGRYVAIANYNKLLFEDPLVWKAFHNTFYLMFLGVPLRLAAALLIAVLLNQKLYGISTFRVLFYLPSVTPAVTVSLVWLWLLNPNFGIVNHILQLFGLAGPGWLTDPVWAKPALVIVSLWGIGPTIVIFLAGLQGISQNLYEAAQIDGANKLRLFWAITMPLLSPVILFNLVMQMIHSFQVFTNVYVMTSGGPLNSTLVYALYLFRNGFLFFEMGYASALAWVMFLVVLGLTLVNLGLSKSWVHYGSEF